MGRYKIIQNLIKKLFSVTLFLERSQDSQLVRVRFCK